MPDTLGYHVVKTTYGTWLPGDVRGFWEDHRFSESGDIGRQERARGKMIERPTILSPAMISAVISAIYNCVARSRGGLVIMAAAIEPTHLHLLIPYSTRDIKITAKWLADQTTKAVHRQTPHAGQVWTKNCWIRRIFAPENWENALQYIDEHNVRGGRGLRPYPFLCEIEL